MKSRETTATHKIALLATGDEITHGDILNSNAREIAKKLSDLGMNVGMHAVTSDTISEIETAMLFLLEHHQALIITGGLGPTSDDLTRYALSKAINQPLIFHEPTWDAIVTRLKNFGYDTPPQSNRQQALFPKDAVIIPNPHGTAAGCSVIYQDKIIFMLPGPPSECLPMVDEVAVQTLQQRNFSQISFHKSWLLFGVSEGQIAEELDELAKPFDCMTGYRIAYPYIEFKIHSSYEKDFLELASLLEERVKPYIISQGKRTASEGLIKIIESQQRNIQLCDRATGGLLESTIKKPTTHQYLHFTDEKKFINDQPGFIISGLNEFWQQKEDSKQTQIEINFQFQNQQKTLSATIPFRGLRVKSYATEWVCWQISNLLLNS